MTQSRIFGPFLAVMLLTLVVWTYMYVRRISFLRASRIDPQSLAVPGALAAVSPAAVANPSDNFKNLFEVPVLFYALCLYLYATNSVDSVYLAAGWAFAAFRVAHSVVHCTFNRVMLRFYLYLAASLVVWLMVVRAALQQFL